MGIIQQIIANSIISGSFYALLAIGITISYDATRFFNFAHGSFALIGAYTVFALSKKAGVDPIVSCVVGMLLAGGIGVFLESFVFSRFRKKKSAALIGLIASLGALTAFESIFALLFSTQFETLPPSNVSPQLFQIGEATVTEYQIYGLIAAIFLTVTLALYIKKSLMGKAIRALCDDEEVARIVGINTNTVMRVVFFIAGATAAVAGIFAGYDIGFDPAIGTHWFLKGTIAAVIGGLGSVPGAFFGSFILGFAENFGVMHISAEWKSAIAFLLLIIFLMFRPQGLFKK